jgi:hypothetical protein
MTTSITKYALEKMGFQCWPPDQPLAAKFYSLHVYEIRGFTLEAPSLEPISGSVAGVAYRLSVGSSVNAVCRQIVQDDYVDSEEQWEKEHKCTPPYLVVYFGPTAVHEFVGSHAKEEKKTISTYEGFPDARAELKAFGEKVLPPLLSALALSFSSNDAPVCFLPTHSTVFGITSDGRTVSDFTISFSGSGYVSSKLDHTQIEGKIAAAVNIASAMNPKVARFFQLALDENDQLKKFLFFFLAIEIETNSTFDKIDHAARLSMLIAASDRVPVSTKELFDRSNGQWTTLRDHFVWCVICVWTHLSDADVKNFGELKKVRDGIAHGRITTPPRSDVATVEKLAEKLLLRPT